MAKDALIATDIEAYLNAHEHKRLLRFITCGSVDDGKSTLIGRLLYDSHLVFDDQLAALEGTHDRWAPREATSISPCSSTAWWRSGNRESPSMWPTASSPPTEKFIVADTPGHEQYTRNMVTGASTADAGGHPDRRSQRCADPDPPPQLSGVPARYRTHCGGRQQTRPGRLLSTVFDQIEADYRAFAAGIGLSDVTCIPISALDGANIVEQSPETPWYHGPTLLAHLEAIDVEDQDGRQPLPHAGPVGQPARSRFPGFSGLIVGGAVRPGDRVRALPSGRTSTVVPSLDLRRRPR